MTLTFVRIDTSLLSRWWWTVDRWMLAALGVLVFCGIILVMAASPAVAVRIGLDRFYLVRHHLVLLPIALAIVLGVSLLNLRNLRRVAVIGFVLSLVLTALTLVAGSEIKGATRWINLGGFSLQPSEFLKSCFAIVAAWLFASQHGRIRVPGNLIAIALYLAVITLLLLQPDLGMTAVVSATWFAQFFLAGLPLLWVVALGASGLGGLAGGYFAFGLVRARVGGFA